jgi:hypothetical protein
MGIEAVIPAQSRRIPPQTTTQRFIHPVSRIGNFFPIGRAENEQPVMQLAAAHRLGQRQRSTSSLQLFQYESFAIVQFEQIFPRGLICFASRWAPASRLKRSFQTGTRRSISDWIVSR